MAITTESTCSTLNVFLPVKALELEKGFMPMTAYFPLLGKGTSNILFLLKQSLDSKTGLNRGLVY